MTFDKQYNKAVSKIDVAINKAVRGASLELFGEIVKRTPVGNPSLWSNKAPQGYIGGTLRGNWQASINRPDYSVSTDHDADGGKTIGKAANDLSKFTLKATSIYFTNNLPYAERVENGYSQQRPSGMMRTTVKQWQAQIEKAARKYKV